MFTSATAGARRHRRPGEGGGPAAGRGTTPQRRPRRVRRVAAARAALRHRPGHQPRRARLRPRAADRVRRRRGARPRAGARQDDRCGLPGRRSRPPAGRAGARAHRRAHAHRVGHRARPRALVGRPVSPTPRGSPRGSTWPPAPLLTAIGGWLLVRRLREPKAGHAHPHDVPAKPLSREGLVALGAAGGLLPSPSALLLLLTALSVGRVGAGLLLIAAFSAGLAADPDAGGRGRAAGSRRRARPRWPAARLGTPGAAGRCRRWCCCSACRSWPGPCSSGLRPRPSRRAACPCRASRW